MAKKVIDIIYNLVRKRLAVFNTKASGSGITRIPTDRQIKKSMQDVFQTLKDGGYNVMSAEKVIQNEDDLARVLTEIQQKQIADAAARKKASEGLERILDKMDRNIPLNPSDQISLEGSGFKTTKDAFKGFEPKVIPGGKKPRDKKSKGGLATALAKLKKKFGKDIIQKGKAPKRNEKKKLQDLFREFNRKNKAGGGVAHMLGEPREEMAAGGIPLRRLLQFLHQGMDKPEKASKGLKKMKLPKQMKFFAEKQGFNPDQVRIDYLENVLDGLKKDRDLIKSVERSPTKNELENMASGAFRESFVDTTQGGRFKGLDSEMIESSILELETILKNLKTKGQGRKLNADGGRIGFADGGMSRRTFLKIMAALAAFPVVGKLAKTTKIAKGAKPIVTPTADMPAHFPKLVEKIIREGQVVKKDFIKKTGDVTTYKHPDRPDIELTIEGDGNRIQLDFDTDQGMKGGYEFKKGST
jgi:inhibitor of KinA sporulation pathway (predicted exonuclease)